MSTLRVESNINIITDGTRGVSLSQVIRTDPSNIDSGILRTSDPSYLGIVQSEKPAITDGRDAKPDKKKDHRRHHRHHSHEKLKNDKPEKPKPAARSHKRHKDSAEGSSGKLHGKPSSVKSRSSKKSSTHGSKKSSKSTTSQVSEPVPIKPDDKTKDLAEMLLERLSGTSVSNDTIRLSSLSLNDDDVVKSDTDASFVKSVSKDNVGKFTKNDGRPLDKDEPLDFRVRFDPNCDAEKRQQLSAHAPLSTQMYVANKYPQWTERKIVRPEENETKLFNAYQPFTLFVTPPEESGNSNAIVSKSYETRPSQSALVVQPSCKYYAKVPSNVKNRNDVNGEVISIHMKGKQEQNGRRAENQNYRRSVHETETFQRNYFSNVPPNNTTV